ncbi:hypothetical protein [Cognatiluteimonas telluris]|uniref:hypothetical protein n=1 Tax=Cognatiluteimonas telluris TaxID=1104775 RepID=UPI0014092C82|nr:hypothetical protein [Lysobacter telluris]
MNNSRAFAVFHFALTALLSVAAFMFLPGYRIWSLASLANLLVACCLVATWTQRKILCGGFATAAIVGLAASSLTLPSGAVREEGILLFVLAFIAMPFVAYSVYRSQLEAAA